MNTYAICEAIAKETGQPLGRVNKVIVAAGGWFLYSFFKAEAAIQSGILALIGVAASAITAYWSAKKREVEDCVSGVAEDENHLQRAAQTPR